MVYVHFAFQNNVFNAISSIIIIAIIILKNNSNRYYQLNAATNDLNCLLSLQLRLRRYYDLYCLLADIDQR